MIKAKKYIKIDNSIIRKRFRREHWLLLKIIMQLGDQEHIPLYIVGGFVRDLLLRRRKYQLDVDIVLEGDALEFAKKVHELLGGKLIVYPKFKTATWYCDIDHRKANNYCIRYPKYKFQIDFITARKETYAFPGALPFINRSNIKDDIFRRDFTINTLAIRINQLYFGRLVDLCSGLRDICLGKIRTLYESSFKDDATRILRAIRYEQRYGFSLSSETLHLIQKDKHFLSSISPHRIKHEFDRIFVEDRCDKVMERLNELSILKEIAPYLIWEKWHSNICKLLPYTVPDEYWGLNIYSSDILRQWITYSIWFFSHRHSIEELFNRFNLELKLKKIVLSLIQLNEYAECIKTGSVSEMVGILDKAHPVSIYVFYLMSSDESLKSRIYLYVSRYKRVQVPSQIKQYIYANIKERKNIGIVLREIRNALLDGKISDEKDAKDIIDKIKLILQ